MIGRAVVGHLLRSLGTQTSPSTPDITSITNSGDGTTVVVEVTGDSDATHTLYYRRSTDDAWTEGDSITGPGTITQTGLDADVYYWFLVIASVDDIPSLPPVPEGITVESEASTSKWYRVVGIKHSPGSLTKSLTLEKIERPINP